MSFGMQDVVFLFAYLSFTGYGLRLHSWAATPQSRNLADSHMDVTLVDLAPSLSQSREQLHARGTSNSAKVLAKLLLMFDPKAAFGPVGQHVSIARPSFAHRSRQVTSMQAPQVESREASEDEKKMNIDLRAELERIQSRKSGLNYRDSKPANGALPQLQVPKSKIRRGDYVIHIDHGIGWFEGIYQSEKIDMENGSKKISKYLKIRFKNEVINMTPRQASRLLKLYKRKEEVGDYGVVTLDSLASPNAWQKRKERAAKKVWEVAADLVKLYAQRQNLDREPCPPDPPRMVEFEASFKYKPTADQQRTFDEIREDMINNVQPMDRLVCGDVGFGKTEVAMRAIYRMVCSGRQVGLLAPTTVLAAQHLRSLRARMPDARVELIATIAKRTAKQQRQLLDDIAEGEVDVLVGTHSILNRKIEFLDLGLLVVDEEQRFGVRQKEKVKGMAQSIDVLSLSATPIPRTMYMCMAGIRAMSTLSSPPEGRKSVITTVAERDDAQMLKAVKEELERGGQVFYVVPRKEMLDSEMNLITKEVPEAKVVVAYGGMKNLEEKIIQFTLGRFNILVATTIMENGIDIPNVNTIVVQASHMFGLAQLHQLRGRVGRSSKQAYAYFFHPDMGYLAEDSVRRLDVLQHETELGAGNKLATADLAIRGAGNLFGSAQKGSNPIGDLGVDMYMEVLQKVMAYMEKKKELGLPDDEEMDSELLAKVIDDSLLVGVTDSLM